MLAVIIEGQCQTIPTQQCVGIFRPEHFLLLANNLPKICLCILIPALPPNCVSETILTPQRLGMVGTKQLNPDIDHSAQGFLCIGIFALIKQ